jgi:hypothetical protein
VLDDGRVVELADPAFRTPHAGPCLTPSANSAYYGRRRAATQWNHRARDQTADGRGHGNPASQR